MAKKDAKDASDEEYQFEVPDFDEDAFIHKEMVSFKTTSTLFAWGVLAALVSWGLWESMDGAATGWYLGLLIVAAFGAALKWLYPLLRLDISHFGRREWLGTGFLLFFTWLAFFLLLTNPPFSDHADPVMEGFASPPLQQEGGDVVLDLFATDNGRIDTFSFTLTQGSTTLATETDLNLVADGHYRYTLEDPGAGTYAYTATATDAKGNAADLEGSVAVSSRALTVNPSSGTLGVTESLVVRLADDTDFDPLNVYLRKDDGSRIYLEYSDDFQGWIATTAYDGWVEGDNTFTAVAEEDNKFFGATTVNGTAIERGPFTLTIDDASGDKQVTPRTKETVPPNVKHTPGLGSLAVAGVLAAAAIVARRRD